MRRSIIFASFLLALVGRTAHAQDNPVIGTFSVNGAKDKQVVVRRSGESTVSLSGKLEDGRERDGSTGFEAVKPLSSEGAAFVGTGAWIFAIGSSVPDASHPENGLTQALGDMFSGAAVGAGDFEAPRGERLELRPIAGGDVELTRFDGASVKSRVKLVRQHAALVFHDNAYSTTDINTFAYYGREVANYYRSKGYPIVKEALGDSWADIAAIVSSAEAEGHPYDRVVFVGHGGWDGPLIWGDKNDGISQASEGMNTEYFHAFTAALRHGTTADAKIFFSACHSGGSNRFELASFGPDSDVSKEHYVDDVARESGRTVAGPMGATSTAFSLRAVKAALEGEGTTAQQTRIAKGSGPARVIAAGGSL
jgi:hypothetical protein